MGIDITAICKQAWRQMVMTKSDLDPSLYTRFDKACGSNMADAQVEGVFLSAAKQCLWERSGDKFALDKNNKKIEVTGKKIVNCLVRMAAEEKWLAKDLAEAPKAAAAPKAVGLPAEATPAGLPADATVVDAKPAEAPKSAGLPGDATPVALSADATPVGLAADATPVVVKAAEAPKLVDTPKVVGLPSDVTPTDVLSLKNRWLIQVGIFNNLTPTGLSVDGKDPKISYAQKLSFAGRVGGLLAPVSLGAYWAYTTFVGLQAEQMTFSAENGESPYNNKLSIWGVGPAVSGYFVYGTGNSGPRVLFGPDLALTVGKLSTEGLVDVGIPDRLYEATGQRNVGTASAGATLGLELAGGPGRPAIMFLLSIGARYFIHGDQVLDTPPGYDGAMVRLKSGPTFDSFKLSIGFNY